MKYRENVKSILKIENLTIRNWFIKIKKSGNQGVEADLNPCSIEKAEISETK